MKNEEEIIAAKEAIKGDWLRRPGVTGMDVGFKYVGGKRTNEVVIRLFVRKKMVDVDPAERFPSLVGQHKTDVIEREFRPVGPALPDQQYYTPMICGVQLWSSDSITTAGMFVTDNDSGQLLILGTFHGEVPPHSQVYQPGLRAQPDEVGDLIGCIVRGGHNLSPAIDADLFSFGGPRDSAFSIEDLGFVNGVRAVGMSDLGMQVSKRGRTTGVTHGLFEGLAGSLSYTVNGSTYENLLDFSFDPSRLPYFPDPVTGAPVFVQPGDSGSVVLDGSNNAIAMLTIESLPLATDGFGPAIPAIISALNVSPILKSTKLPSQITLSSSETPTSPPHDGWGDKQTDPAWGESVTGEIIEGRKIVRRTITNVFQELCIRATVTGFERPQFSWSIKGEINPQSFPGVANSDQQLNDFNKDGQGRISFMTMISRDVPNLLVPIVTLEEATLVFDASSAASYDIGGTFCEVFLYPSAVQGHIMLTIEVQVRDTIHGPEHGPERPKAISKSGVYTLDTQVLSIS